MAVFASVPFNQPMIQGPFGELYFEKRQTAGPEAAASTPEAQAASARHSTGEFFVSVQMHW